MDLTLSEDQKLIQETARELLEGACPPDHVRAMEDDPRGYSTELWGEMAELGWMGTAFPEEHGGSGYGFFDLCLLIEEQGRVRLPSPFLSTVVLCGLAIERFGSEEQKAEHLAAIAAGERILAWAETDPVAAEWGEPASATADGDGYVLDGTKLFVPYARAADHLLVAARVGGGGDEETTDVVLILVDAGADGVSSERLGTIDSGHDCRVSFREVAVPAEAVLVLPGEGADAVRAVRERGAAATCAAMLGGAQKVLDMSLEYAAQREQFGRPIGTFQAVQHHCADMAVDVAGSRFITYEAVWRLGEGLEAAEEVSAAKAWVSDAYQRVCQRGHQIHGAIGFTEEHELQLYSRHAKAAEQAFGDADHHRELVARRLGL